jgi:transmembrane 9 superfamily protein 1
VACVFSGVGSQFLALATGILMMALLGMFNVHRHGTINSAAIVLYAFTSCISGYVASNMYRKMGGESWVWNINLTSFLFAGRFSQSMLLLVYRKYWRIRRFTFL